MRGFRPPADPGVLAEPALWLDERYFWPAFLVSFGGAKSAATAFDADPADVEEHLEELHRRDCWPFLTVRLAHGHRLQLLFRNYEGDSGWDYLLQPAGSDALVTFAALEGGFHGPGLSWPELIVAAGQADPDRGSAERLLLLLPALGDADLPDDAADQVAAAFTAVGGLPQHRHAVAGELLTASDRFWGHPAWVDFGDRLVCLGRHSPRDPGAPAERLALITEALGPG